MAKGWIKLHRQIQDNEMWNEKPYDRTHAWVDMIFMANIDDKEMNMRHIYTKMQVNRGSFFTSYNSLAKRWGWSVAKVRRYLRYLIAQEMVTVSGTASGTLITLVKYGVYQDGRHSNDTSGDTSNDTSGDTTGDTRLKNIYKNDNKKYKEHKDTRTQTADDINAIFEKMKREGKI